MSMIHGNEWDQMRWGLFEGAALKGSFTGRMYLWVREGAGFLQCFK